MTAEKHIKTGLILAGLSFLLGTAIFLWFYFTASNSLLFVGYGFILLAGFANLSLLISILMQAAKDETNKKELHKTAGLMLLNIPIMLVYCWIAAGLLNTMRITFTNSTQAILTDIKISGCETQQIDKLEIGEAKEVWIKIKGDCTIYLDYLSNGTRRMERAVEYATPSMGGKMNYNIGG